MSLKWGVESEVVENRDKFLKKFGISFSGCVATSLVHGTNIAVVDQKDKGKYFEADGLITKEQNLGLWMVTGDCLPIGYFETDNQCLGLAHCGWRGVNLRLAEKMVLQMKEQGADPAKIQIRIGPCARKQSYLKAGESLVDFRKSINTEQWKDFLEERKDGKVAIDMVGLVRQQLVESGVAEKNIDLGFADTITDLNYFSQYRSYSTHEPQGRFATVAMMIRQ